MIIRPVALICAVAAHPVRQEIVDEIKLKATSWKPKEVNENHLRHIDVSKSMGHLGMTPFNEQAKFGVHTWKVIEKELKKITMKFKGHWLHQAWKDWDVVDDDVEDDSHQEQIESETERDKVYIHEEEQQVDEKENLKPNKPQQIEPSK